MLVAHDVSQIVGWTHPLVLHFEPGLTRAVGLTQLAENNDESRRLVQHFQNHLYSRFSSEHGEDIDYLKQILAGNLAGDELAIEAECVALVAKGLAKRVFPNLFSQPLQDRYGLVPVNQLNPIGPGVYQSDELVLFAHWFFRRNLFRLNSLNYPFLEQLQSISDINPSAKVALDPDMLGLASTYNGGRLELAYWWGPKFNDDLAQIPVGVTHHEADELEKVCYGISSTQFRWGSRKGEHIFEVEELRDIPSAVGSENRYGCRFAHSIVFEETGLIDHIDGSIRMYSEEAMIERLEVDLAHAKRDTEYTKLWRADNVNVPIWKRLLSDYFRDNHLIGEYLGADKQELLEFQRSSDEAQRPLSEVYTPYSMTPGMGVRVALAYQPLRHEMNSDREVVALDSISDGNTTYQYVESDVLELKKILIELGASLHISDEIKTVSFKDFHVNLPLILHSDLILPDGLHTTIEAIKILVDFQNSAGYDSVVCYKLGFPVDDKREAWVSIMGHISDVAKWLSDSLSHVPVTPDELHSWSEAVASYLKEEFPIPTSSKIVFETLMSSGLLLIDRRRIEIGDFRIQHSEELQAHLYELQFDKDDETLAKTLQEEGIVPSVGFLILESECTKCRQPYETCSCSKMFDKEVAREIKSALPFPFWTDKPLDGYHLS